MPKGAPVLFLYLIFYLSDDTAKPRGSVITTVSLSYESPEGTWGFFLKKSHEKFVKSNCAIRSNGLVIRSHGLVIRSLELDSSFSRIAICSFELDNPFSRVASRSLELRVVQF